MVRRSRWREDADTRGTRADARSSPPRLLHRQLGEDRGHRRAAVSCWDKASRDVWSAGLSRRRTGCLVFRRDQSSELRDRPAMSESPQIMPPFTCPRCGKDYIVPLAFCEAFLDDTPIQTRE